MSMETTAAAPAARAAYTPPVALSLAWRELKGGIAGFRILVACIALGVAVIAGVGALGDAIATSLARQGATLIGGDITLSRPHRRAEDAERRILAASGRVSESAGLRAMARRLDGADQLLIEAKGVDSAYPLIGSLQLAGGPADPTPVSPAFLFEPAPAAAVAPILLERLGIAVGDRFRLGRIEVVARAVIVSEPDKISDRLAFGPRVLVSIATLEASGLADPGGLAKWRYAIALDSEHSAGDDQALRSLRTRLQQALPEAGFTIIDRRDPNPQVTRAVDRMRQFLTLVGLTALLVGGVGVANAVAAYIDRRRKVIATLKSLGASRAVVFQIHLVQVMAMTALGILIGLGLGLALPRVVTAMVAGTLPIELEHTVSIRSLALAAAYGVLVALLFALWPLGRAGLIRPSALYRDEVAEAPVRAGWPMIAATAAVGALLLTLAMLTSDVRRLALYFCLGVAGVLVLFWLLGWALTVLARSLPRPRRPELSLALGSIGAPGGLTRTVTVSLGAGLSLLVAVALVDASIVGEMSSRLPRNSPSFFVLDLPKSELPAFRTLVRDKAPTAHVNEAPMLRGRIVRIGDTPADQVRTTPETEWVLRGDRGLSYADEVPEGSTVIAGEWWPKHYAGEPLVSFERELAKALGLKLGDTVTVNVLGRNVTARIANLREVRWESFAINFVMVFSPNTLAGAPHNALATVALAKDAPLGVEGELHRRIGQEFPSTTIIGVREALNAFQSVFSRVATAVRVAAGVTLLSGALVLAGAMAAARRQRLQTAVLMKALGATRRRVIGIHITEYLILSIATAALAVLLGTLAAWIVSTRIMDMPLVLSPRAILEALALSLALVLLLGGISTWRILATRPVPHLRAD